MSTEAQSRASYKWKRANLKQVAFDVRPEYYNDVLKPAADAAGQSVRAFLIQAIDERVERMKEGN